jgi:hypothetical protein
LWEELQLSRYKLFASERHAITLVFVVGAILRSIPELAAYPNPIGYDVINYYLPVVSNFDSYWNVVSGQFPVYVILLHVINLTGLLSPYWTVVIGAITIFGFFSAVIFVAGRSLMKLSVGWSIFLAVFVMFQLAVLRTSWDEHRDIFALSTAILAFVLIDRKRDNSIGWKTIVLAAILSGVTAASDRQIGALFCAVSMVYSSIVRTKAAIVCTIPAVTIFVLLFLFSGNNSWIWQSLENHLALPETHNARPPETITSYGSLNLMLYFVVMDALLVPTAIIGFGKAHSLLKISLLITITASFSWIIFPNAEALIANRWITLAGVFLSIFSGRGIVELLDKVKIKYSASLAAAVLSYFIIAGLGFALLPYDAPFFLFAITRDNIQEFSPVTMQFNSLQLKDNDKMISAITWINNNTEHNAVIVGQKHWLGFMELYLKDERSYYFSDNPEVLTKALEDRGENVYLMKFDGSLPTKFTATGYSILR